MSHHVIDDARQPWTLEAIAREAAVSVATASRVLNDRPGISDVTRKRVLEVMGRRGYRKRGVDPEHSAQIELVFGTLEGAWPIELIRGVSRVAAVDDMAVSVSETGDSPDPGHWAAAVARRRPAGVILVASDLHQDAVYRLRSRGIPFVVVDPAGDPPADVPSVGSTNWAGGLAATRHLLALGHTRIGVVAATDSLMAVRARVAGYRSALEEANVPLDDALVYARFVGDEASPLATETLLDLAEPPTAIFATSDVKAFGVYEAARRRGLTVPRDLSVVGYDDLPLARLAEPPLTTVHQPLADMAEAATRLVLGLRRGEAPKSARVELTTSLVVRKSTAAPGRWHAGGAPTLATE